MATSPLKPLVDVVARRVLLFIEDPTLLELLGEALDGAGHRWSAVSDYAELDAALAETRYDAAVVDIDTRARNGEAVVAMLRGAIPSLTVVALLPCGGLAPGREIAYHLALEKPARLEAVVRAVNAARTQSTN